MTSSICNKRTNTKGRRLLSSISARRSKLSLPLALNKRSLNLKHTHSCSNVLPSSCQPPHRISTKCNPSPQAELSHFYLYVCARSPVCSDVTHIDVTLDNKTSGERRVKLAMELFRATSRVEIETPPKTAAGGNFVNSKSRGSAKRHFYSPQSFSTFIIHIVRNTVRIILSLSLLVCEVCTCENGYHYTQQRNVRCYSHRRRNAHATTRNSSKISQTSVN